MTPWINWLPTVNACLNSVATVLLLMAYQAIRERDEQKHRKLMLSALGVSGFFLLFYTIYHMEVGSVPFQGQGWIRTLYFLILIPHILLAAMQLPMIALAVYFAIKDQRSRHIKIVHWAYPVWLYVSVSGVLVYLMLYHLPVNG
ncbi:MAG: DUF420 domain-containing protein [SAR324 cluster bacterium]|nr:DUF420 domain-containing protein [SAR324 cluster bacterium]